MDEGTLRWQASEFGQIADHNRRLAVAFCSCPHPRTPMEKMIRMTEFTKQDVALLLEDLQLYSGNISKITDVDGPHEFGGSITGKIHTWMDQFSFMATPMFCDSDSWTIDLADPVESLRRGHRRITRLTFPKLHKDAALQKRYLIANLLYHAYNGYSNVTEASRLPDHERLLGYENFPSYSHVLEAIIRDFRSYQDTRTSLLKEQHSKN